MLALHDVGILQNLQTKSQVSYLLLCVCVCVCVCHSIYLMIHVQRDVMNEQKQRETTTHLNVEQTLDCDLLQLVVLGCLR